jgi:hypothetical protein
VQKAPPDPMCYGALPGACVNFQWAYRNAERKRAPIAFDPLHSSVQSRVIK